jgi:hypothetical protein
MLRTQPLDDGLLARANLRIADAMKAGKRVDGMEARGFQRELG